MCHDYYYKSFPNLTYEERTKLNYDHPQSFDTDMMVEHIKALKEGVNVAIAGRPNVGKSTLLNRLVGEQRAMVSDIAGTTRDSIATLYNKFGHEFMLVDTAGMRKKTKVH